MFGWTFALTAPRAPVPTWRRLALIAAALLAPLPASAQNGPPSVAPVAERLLEAVVDISTTQSVRGPQGNPLPHLPEGSPFEEFFKDFFDRDAAPGDQQQLSSLGSGFVIDPSGLIATNNHVIADADEIFVAFADGTKLKVDKVVGRDPKTDLALLKVTPTKPLKAVPFGDSARLRVGDWVMAIGNPLGFGGSLSLGVISAKQRHLSAGSYDDYLQTDTAVNKGNSGGPLFNMDGEVVGVVTAIVSPSGVSIGLAFAIPSNTVVGVIEQLKSYGEVRRGWIGVSVQTVTPEIAESLGMPAASGALIAELTKDGPADRGGIRTGDVVLKVGGEVVSDMRALPRIVARLPIGKPAAVEIIRGGKPLTLAVVVDRLAEAAIEPAAVKPEGGETVEDEALFLGLSISAATPELRQQFGLPNGVDGVVVASVEPKSVGAGKGIKPGEVITEVTNEKVRTPQDFIRRIAAIKASGRKSALLLVSDPRGEIRFVAVPVE